MERRPEWDACSRHVPDSASVRVVHDLMGESPGRKFVFLQMKCKRCGCPGETMFEMMLDDIGWDPED